MTNMSYCRWQNTARDLADCKNALEDLVTDGGKLSREERAAAFRLFEIAVEMLSLVGVDVDDQDASQALRLELDGAESRADEMRRNMCD